MNKIIVFTEISICQHLIAGIKKQKQSQHFFPHFPLGTDKSNF